MKTFSIVICGVVFCPAAGVVADDGRSEPPQVRPHAAMMRFPDVSRTHVVFVYANDLWLAPREGGTAVPVASPPGPEMFPRFSPDGGTIAFTGNYDGNQDLYVIPAVGGIPTRVTHHPDAEMLCDWTPDGRLLFYTNAFAGLRRQMQLFTVAAEGGLPEKLSVPYGTNGAISADGRWLAYTPHTTDFRTWKRYRGGMATDVWLFNLRKHASKKITDWEGTDTLPMWHGDAVYYLSDADQSHRLNIWRYDTETGRRKQVTKFKDYDVKWPSMGPGPDGDGEIVFQNGSDLYLLDLATGRSRAVEISIPGDRPIIRPRSVNAEGFVASWGVSPTGKRAVIEARGDIWTVPAHDGSPRNLTRTIGAAERYPAWSPDGRWIAYLSDESGEYELYVMQSDGTKTARRLTHDGKVFRYGPAWSPDSKRIAFSDKTGAVYLHNVADGDTKRIDTDPWAGPTRVSWSPDSNWLAYAKAGDNRVSAVWLYDAASDQKHRVTDGMFNDSWPTFDRKGKYLFYASNREFSTPIYEDLGTTFVYAGTDRLLCVPLRAEVGSPLAPKSDEENWKDKEKKPAEDEAGEDKQDEDKSEEGENQKDDEKSDDDDEEAKKDKKDKKKDVEPVKIELDGFERRAILLPVGRGSFSGLSVNDKGQLIYVRGAPRGVEGEPSIKLFDLKEDDKGKREEKTVLEGTGSYDMSADGKKLLVRKGGAWAVIDAAADQKMERPMSLAGMAATVDPRTEWRQIFVEAWRILRDFFYDPHMHGVNWKDVRRQYQKMLDDCVSREDISYVIGEMISELNVGHAYVMGHGDADRAPSTSVGMLGADFELHDEAYRIARIYEGAPWDADARGPLSQPGVDVKVGDYLLAVNGAPVDAGRDPWAAFQGMADRVVTLTVSAEPTLDDEARQVVVRLLSSESGLRYRAWVEEKRSYVDKKSEGRVGYIYVPNTGVDGQNELFRQFYGQVDKAAIIIDERWNGGGQIPTRFIELLDRPITNYWARRDGNDWPWPPDAHQGPKCMLINGLAGSGGDAFPAYFRQAGVGKLIGMRTWGGLVGISGNPQFIDGGASSAPTFAYYEKDGTWGIEGHGVDPDIEVIDDPALMVDGGDPQLDAAVRHMLDELKRSPYVKPRRPKYPDRRGMGIRDTDK